MKHKNTTDVFLTSRIIFQRHVRVCRRLVFDGSREISTDSRSTADRSLLISPSPPSPHTHLSWTRKKGYVQLYTGFYYPPSSSLDFLSSLELPRPRYCCSPTSGTQETDYTRAFLALASLLYFQPHTHSLLPFINPLNRTYYDKKKKQKKTKISFQ